MCWSLVIACRPRLSVTGIMRFVIRSLGCHLYGIISIHYCIIIYRSRNDVDTFEHDYTFINKIERVGNRVGLIVNLLQFNI